MEDLSLVQATLERHVHPAARVLSVEEEPIVQGYSGALVRRLAVAYSVDDEVRHTRLVVKHSPLRERLVLDRLNAQGLPGIPFSHTTDLSTDAAAPLAMRDVGGDSSPPPEDIVERTARALAGIHLANRGTDGLDFLPRSDFAFVQRTVLANWWWPFWEKALRNEAFAREFGPYTEGLREGERRLAETVDALWGEGDSLTLIHSDMHPGYGSHVLVSDGEPYIVDWEQARYGPLYLDLPNHFPPGAVERYRQALAEGGFEIAPEDFLERYREAGRYVGFKYVSWCMGQWRPGDEGRTVPLLTMLKLITEGAVISSTPEGQERERLLAEHRRTTAAAGG